MGPRRPTKIIRGSRSYSMHSNMIGVARIFFLGVHFLLEKGDVFLVVTTQYTG